mgnify:CR=1 FL=1
MKRRVIVSALISCEDDYLFIKQEKKGGAYQGMLHIPGGGLEDGEHPLDGVIREVKEETGLDIYNIKPFDFADDFVEYKGEQTQFIFLRYTAESVTHEAVASSDAKEIIWVHKDRLLDYPQNPATIDLLKKLALI